MFGETYIEDLWLPYLCTTSNLTTASAQAHASGMVWKNVRASSSVGVILPPVLENNQLLVDGGLLNNLPVREVRELAEGGPVIAVNVTNEFVRQKPYDFHDFSLRSMLWQRINPFSKKQIAPSITDVLLRALEVPSLQSKSDQIQLADVYIRPDVENFGTIDSTNIEQLIQNGYDAAVEALCDFDWNSFDARRSDA
jgi:predicted acylesterase/phospholipase RssA